MHRPHLPVRAPRRQLQPPFLINKSIIVEPGTTASNLPWESWGQNPLCKETLRPWGAWVVVARLAGVLVGQLALPSPAPRSGPGASGGSCSAPPRSCGSERLTPPSAPSFPPPCRWARGLSPHSCPRPNCLGPWPLSTQLPMPRLLSVHELWPLSCAAPASWDHQTPTARDPTSPPLRRGCSTEPGGLLQTPRWPASPPSSGCPLAQPT